jgi:ribosomal protein L7/L12
VEYALILVVVSGLIAWNEISNLKKKNRELENRLNKLAKMTGNSDLSSDYISDDLKQQLLELKNKGADIEAVKCLRTVTGLDLLTAKQYIDELK